MVVNSNCNFARGLPFKLTYPILSFTRHHHFHTSQMRGGVALSRMKDL